MALLYFGPEVLMPVLSAVAAAVGAILIVGKRALHWIRTVGRWIADLFGRSGSEVDEVSEVDAVGEDGARSRASSSDSRPDGS